VGKTVGSEARKVLFSEGEERGCTQEEEHESLEWQGSSKDAVGVASSPAMHRLFFCLAFSLQVPTIKTKLGIRKAQSSGTIEFDFNFIGNYE